MEGEREADRRAGLGYPPYSRYNAGKDKGKEREENNKDEELLGDDDVWRLPLNHTPSGYLDFDKLEQASMDKALDEDNIGFRLLQKMGWKAGQGLGKEGSGIVAPIRVDIKEDFLGLGKKEQEETYATEATAKRKTLESEKEETEELKRRREEKVEKEHSIKQEVTEILDVFHCKLCNKQYTNVAQYDAHLSSYDHHHKKRLEEARKSDHVAKAQMAKNKRREERRERKRMEKLHAAAAASVAKASQEQPVLPQKPPPPLPSAPPPAPATPPPPAPSSASSTFAPPPPPPPDEPPIPTSTSSPVSFGFALQPPAPPPKSTSRTAFALRPPPPPLPSSSASSPASAQATSQPVKFSFAMGGSGTTKKR